ncbi:Cellulose binding domain-containing protein [Micromonospora pallida]|uniref:Cellulose binding domain-containing protein n=1 Tax=Micromonospora pallida TaxID=145854 RepID=A0A1C6RQS8_9ACTN|nr:cellulose binding domain-containing protein [Micromonospora pallida]SCL19387.1 Cellulose binding domain-containing protein [Micromonospora pallida]
MASRRRAWNGSGAFLLSPWAVVSVGVLVMVVLLGIALGAVVGNRSEPGPPLATDPLPSASAASFAASRNAAPTASRTDRPSPTPFASPAPVVSPTSSRSPSPPAEPAGAPLLSPPPAAPAPPGQVTGVYRTVTTYDKAFLGEVRLTNSSDVPRNWTVRVELPGTRLVSSLVEGLVQAEASGSRSRFTFTSGVALAPGTSVSLRFHLSNAGSATRPTSCRVDDVPCEG